MVSILKFNWEGLAEIWPFIAILFTLIIIGLIFAIRYELNKKREREAAGIQKVRLTYEDKIKVVVWSLVGITCVFMFFGGIVGLAFGIANPSQTKYDTEECSLCGGDGLLSDKSCSICDGKGYIITTQSFTVSPVLGVFGIIVGGVGYFISLSKTQSLKKKRWSKPQYERQQPKPIQPNHLQPKPKQTAILNDSDLKEIEMYKKLLDMGVITQEEFDAKKKQLLGL